MEKEYLAHGGKRKGGNHLEKENVFCGGEEKQRRRRRQIFGEGRYHFLWMKRRTEKEKEENMEKEFFCIDGWTGGHRRSSQT